MHSNGTFSITNMGYTFIYYIKYLLRIRDSLTSILKKTYF